MTLVLGVGASSSVTTAELDALVSEVLAQQGFSVDDVSLVATREGREPLLQDWCDSHDWPLVAHDLEGAVAEAAAQRHGALVTPKAKSAHATVAIARRP